MYYILQFINPSVSNQPTTLVAESTKEIADFIDNNSDIIVGNIQKVNHIPTYSDEKVD